MHDKPSGPPVPGNPSPPLPPGQLDPTAAAPPGAPACPLSNPLAPFAGHWESEKAIQQHKATMPINLFIFNSRT